MTTLFSSVQTWQWNKYFSMLYPASDLPTRPFEGVQLADAWNEHGLSGLVFVLNQEPARVAVEAAV